MQTVADQIVFLKPLIDSIKGLSVQEKLLFLEKQTSFIVPASFTPTQRMLACSLELLGQTHLLGESLVSWIDRLIPVEEFYEGGVLGYHLTLLELVHKACLKNNETYYHAPPLVDLRENSTFIKAMTLEGVHQMPFFAEVYPVGGAGDRLNLKDEKSGEPLPVAKLNFLGKTLLEGLVLDLQARERLYYLLYGRQVRVPIILMTSEQKNNTAHILEICKECHWFHRPRNSFEWISQPQVPVITVEGIWASENLIPLFKPGGHGVIWKLLLDYGVMDRLLEQGVEHFLVRQINNPIAGLNANMLALAGYGAHSKKAFGFTACERLAGAAEGVDVLVEEEVKEGYSYGLRNIEYPQFKQMELHASLECPANVNLLYANIRAIKEVAKKQKLPGLLVNLNKEFPIEAGQKRVLKGGRIESTMQNIADHLGVLQPMQVKDFSTLSLQSFVLFNARKRLISVTKRAHVEGESLKETPAGALQDLMENFRDVLRLHCGFEVASDAYLFLHPALGPLWEIIGEKIQKGRVHAGSRLHLECAEVHIEDLTLQGSLVIEAQVPMGHLENEELIYSHRCGKVELLHVEIRQLHLVLEGDAEFSARNVLIERAETLCVPSGYRLEIDEEGEHLKKIDSPTWHWGVRIEGDAKIVLEKIVF